MSNKIYVISDLHLGHDKIAKLRGFENSVAHDIELIKNWNEIVNKRDTVWVLGDIAMNKSHYHLLDNLKGIKNIVLGNHDLPQHITELQKHTNKICGSFKIKDCVFTHIPIHSSEFYRFKKNIHGHTHQKCILDDRYKNVCVEQTDMKPVLLSDLLK